MKLITYCHICKNKIRFSSWKSDRVELSKSKGIFIELKCNACNNKDLFHVNEISATENKIVILLGLTILAIGIPFLLSFTWDYIFHFANIYAIAQLIGIIGIPFLAFSILEKEHKKKVRLFNKFNINDKEQSKNKIY